MRFNNLSNRLKRLRLPSYGKFSRGLDIADQVFLVSAWLAVPAGLAVLILTGEGLKNSASLAQYPHTNTLKGWHYLAGFLWGGGMVLQTFLFGMVLWRKRREDPLSHRFARQLKGLGLVRVTHHMVAAILLISGLVLLLAVRFDTMSSGVVMPLSLWRMVHGITPPYLYGVLVLETFLLARNLLPVIRQVLYSR